MTRVLDEILRPKRAEVAELEARACVSGEWKPRRSLVVDGLRRPADAPLRVIGEIKRRSPSAGPLSTALSVAERAVVYGRGGVAMISVLCDGPFFDGAFAHVAEARAALAEARLAVPVLAKEFVLAERQLDEAAAHGADAALLIARIVDPAALARLVAHARALELEPLVEVVTEAEIEAALAAGATVIGVNARDLDTLVMDRARAARLLAAIPAGRVAIHLSGLKSSADVADVARTRADGALIGEALMRHADPAPLLAELRAACAT